MQIKMIFLCQSLEIHPEHTVGSGILPAHHLNSAIQHRLRLVRYHQVRVRNQLETQTGTVRTGAGRIVEGEHAGLQLCHADAAIFTSIVLGKTQFFLGCGQFNNNQATGMGTGRFNGVGQAAAQTLF